MPRNPGTGVYEQPLPDVITATTIESAVYNGFVNDVETDLNLPRPIVAGGTGATSAAGARDNLDAEVAGVQVTNYDTHVWEQGSFYSLSSATGEPVDGHAFAGICYGVIDTVTPANSKLVVEARDLDDATTPGLVYAREKIGAAAWSAWALADSGAYVLKTGDTMTGNLTISKSNPTLTLNKTDATDCAIYGQHATSTRWAMHLGAGDTHFYVTRYNDVGVAINNPVQIDRTTGAISLNGILAVSGASQINSSLTTTGDTTSGGTLTGSNGFVISKSTVGNSCHFYLNDETGAAQGIFYWNRPTGQIIMQKSTTFGISIESNGAVKLSLGFLGRNGYGGAFNGYLHNFVWTGSALQAWVDNTNMGNITITSDYRIKKDVVDLSGTWDAVKALRPIKYTQAQYTPQIEIAHKLKEAVTAREAGLDVPQAKEGSELQPMFEADNVERWGFLAHELQETLTPSVASGVKDQPDAIQTLNIDGVVAALTKALQEAMARIEALEAAQATP